MRLHRRAQRSSGNASLLARCYPRQQEAVERVPRMLSSPVADMIPIAEGLLLDEREIEESFIRASGPGGQNVNKVASAVQLRFDVRRSSSLPEAVRQRLERLAGNRLTQDGVLVLTAQRFRSQERNREDALERLIGLIRRAATPPRPRRPTRPSAAARQRRLTAKARRSRLKRERASAPDE